MSHTPQFRPYLDWVLDVEPLLKKVFKRAKIEKFLDKIREEIPGNGALYALYYPEDSDDWTPEFKEVSKYILDHWGVTEAQMHYWW